MLRNIRYISILGGILASFSVCGITDAVAHGSGITHMIEMYSVLPFEAKDNGHAVEENKAIEDWLGMITSDLIDNYWGNACPEFEGKTFYDYLRDEFGFRCKHRLLFHWGFNARPWSADLEAKIRQYEWYSDETTVKKFKEAFVIEQTRRNRKANALTEDLFGFSSSGKESAWANGILAIMYDVHLLGDYVPDDNRDFDGVTKPSSIVGDIINALRRIDSSQSQELEKILSSISKSVADEHQMAIDLISALQENLPGFILKANNGAVKVKFLAKGFVLRQLES